MAIRTRDQASFVVRRIGDHLHGIWATLRAGTPRRTG
jgi:hypothetical protein